MRPRGLDGGLGRLCSGNEGPKAFDGLHRDALALLKATDQLVIANRLLTQRRWSQAEPVGGDPDLTQKFCGGGGHDRHNRP